jgi:hypothetical protein
LESLVIAAAVAKPRHAAFVGVGPRCEINAYAAIFGFTQVPDFIFPAVNP